MQKPSTPPEAASPQKAVLGAQSAYPPVVSTPKPTEPPFQKLLSEIEQERKIFGDSRLAISDIHAGRLGRGAHLAKAVSPQELHEWRYVEQLVDSLRAATPEGKGPNAEILRVLMDSGALLEDPKALTLQLPLTLALENPARWMSALPDNPAWALATSDAPSSKKISLAGSGMRYARLLQDLADDAAWEKNHIRHLDQKHSIPPAGASAMREQKEEKRAAEDERLRVLRAAQKLLAEKSRGPRLTAIQAAGRGGAWLAHALIAAPLEEAREAFAAGMRLDHFDSEGCRALFSAMMREWRQSSAVFMSNEGLFMGAKKRNDERLRLEGLDVGQLWERWEIAIQAGLPPLRWDDASRAEMDARDLAFTHSLAQVILIQEMRRPLILANNEASAPLASAWELDASLLAGMNRNIWASAAAIADWHPELAARVGAKNDESSMDWAWRRGMDRAAWDRHELLQAIFVGHGRPHALATLQSIAQAGVSLAPGDRIMEGVLSAALEFYSGAPERQIKALDCLVAMGETLESNKIVKKHVVKSLLETPREGAVQVCRHALAVAESQAAGSADALMQERGASHETSLHWAARNLDIEAMQLCVEHGVSVNARDSAGQTPLHWAARRYGKKTHAALLSVAKWLKERGADPMAADRKNRTAVALLAGKGAVDPVLEFVKEAPEMLEIRDHSGKTAFEAIAKHGGEKLAKLEEFTLGQELAKSQGARFANKCAANQKDGSEIKNMAEAPSFSDNAASPSTPEPTPRKPRRM